MKTNQFAALAASLFAIALAASACGGDISSQAGGAAGDDTQCGKLNIAVNAWVGYEASANVLGEVAETKLGCTVEYINLGEEVSWQAMASGEVDVVVEDWGHPDLASQYIADDGGDGSIQYLGDTGNVGRQGWFIPQWMAEEHPDITNWENLNKYADLFRTPESGGKGQVLGSDPTYVNYDEAIINNLGLDYQVVYSGSEAASIAAFESANTNRTPLLAYFWEPQWIFASVPLARVNLPAYTEGCQDNAQEVDCDYAEFPLVKVVSTKFAESGSTAVNLVRNFNWTNEEQNAVALSMVKEGLSGKDAAKRWIDAHPEAVDSWTAKTD